jgi:hypothetical protein
VGNAAAKRGVGGQKQISSNEARSMLGRHVYRVHPADGRWTITKEGEDQARGDFARREEATTEACRLADADQPSRVLVDDGDGVILEERLFGSDLSQEFEQKVDSEPG